MPLNVASVVTGQVIQAVHITQFNDLLTGVMVDQAVTLKNQLTVGGNQGIAAVPLNVQGVNGQTADYFDITSFGGGAGGVFRIPVSGNVTFGLGLTVTTAGITVSAGGIAVNNGGITVLSGGISVTGNSSIVGTLTNTGIVGINTPVVAGQTITIGGPGGAPTTAAGIVVLGQSAGTAANYAAIFNQPSGGSTHNVSIAVIGISNPAVTILRAGDGIAWAYPLSIMGQTYGGIAANNFMRFDISTGAGAGAVIQTLQLDGTGTVKIGVGGLAPLSGNLNVAGPVIFSGNMGFYAHAVAAQQVAPAAATDLASVITLANFFRTTFQGNGLVG